LFKTYQFNTTDTVCETHYRQNGTISTVGYMLNEHPRQENGARYYISGGYMTLSIYDTHFIIISQDNIGQLVKSQTYYNDLGVLTCHTIYDKEGGTSEIFRYNETGQLSSHVLKASENKFIRKEYDNSNNLINECVLNNEFMECPILD